jgi:hypothetical protein
VADPPDVSSATVVIAISDVAITLIVAGAAALGAAIGGGITGWVTLRAEGKRQAFARELEQNRADRETAERVAELRIALRLVANDLAVTAARLQTGMKIGFLRPAEMPTSAWRAHRGALAKVLSTDAWLALSSAYATVGYVAEELQRQGVIRNPELERYLNDIQVAQDHLLPYLAGATLDLPDLPVAERPPEDPPPAKPT